MKSWLSDLISLFLGEPEGETHSWLTILSTLIFVALICTILSIAPLQ